MACKWHLPLSHALESWGDARALDGTASLAQPLIQRLYVTRTCDEYLAALANEPVTDAYDLTRNSWRASANGDFESWWRQALHDGVIADTAGETLTVPAPPLPQMPPPEQATGLTLVLSPHPALRDGRGANNPWLQECPAPFTKQVWGNAVTLAPEDAARLGLADEDTVALDVAGHMVAAPVVVMPGQAEGVAVSHWGHGRSHAGRIGDGVGARWVGLGNDALPRRLAQVRLKKSSQQIFFRSTQAHTRLSGRAEELFKIARDETARIQPPKSPASLLPTPTRGDYAWAMVVDTDACIGCNACVIACQAENNIPVVGAEQVRAGRELHWLRVDRYTAPATAEAGTRTHFQPVPCMHCEHAPCEEVCPVGATVHNAEGLNLQVYNRCVGTRFCSQNCPYKVRHFNFLQYSGDARDPAELRNPEVSVRRRGVMEKCTYCVQRITRARIESERLGRPLRDGEVLTACQAACPTQAIVFGDLNLAAAEVARRKSLPRDYALLGELNTRPRTTYLARVHNDGDADAPA
jgi:molybdopterin-containing oxidoreductase family iron-sulfur binding subunit